MLLMMWRVFTCRLHHGSSHGFPPFASFVALGKTAERRLECSDRRSESVRGRPFSSFLPPRVHRANEIGALGGPSSRTTFRDGRCSHETGRRILLGAAVAVLFCPNSIVPFVLFIPGVRADEPEKKSVDPEGENDGKTNRHSVNHASSSASSFKIVLEIEFNKARENARRRDHAQTQLTYDIPDDEWSHFDVEEKDELTFMRIMTDGAHYDGELVKQNVRRVVLRVLERKAEDDVAVRALLRIANKHGLFSGDHTSLSVVCPPGR